MREDFVSSLEKALSGQVSPEDALNEAADKMNQKLQDYLELYGADALILFIKTESGELLIRTAESTAIARSGQTLIALVPEKE